MFIVHTCMYLLIVHTCTHVIVHTCIYLLIITMHIPAPSYTQVMNRAARIGSVAKSGEVRSFTCACPAFFPLIVTHSVSNISA